MSTEVVPETVLRAFIRTYPDLFPSQDLSHLGLIPDPEFGWPIGFSRKEVSASRRALGRRRELRRLPRRQNRFERRRAPCVCWA